MSAAHAATIDPRSTVQQLTLDNGLELVWEEDHRQPLVALEARIRGGLRGEGAWVGTGITHFIEHMLFKGTRSRAPGRIEQEVRRYGGTINAFTSFDTTGISLFVESRYLKDGLSLLADILQQAVFDEAEFEKERAVIISEIQMNLDDPQRRIHQLFWGRHFLVHPYRHPILGYQSLLERLTVNDLRTFYATFYQPQHVVLACAGDLDGAAFRSLASSIFGAWPRGTTDLSRQMPPLEPPVPSAKEMSVELPVQTAYVILGFSSTRLSDPQTYPLDLLAGIIGQGRSSRLYEEIVRERKLAHEIAAWNYTPADPGVLAIQWQTEPDKVAGATQAVLDVLEAVKRRGVTEAELRKAKRMVSADHLFALQTIEAKAADLATSLASTGDPLFSRRYVEAINQVSREQIQEAAARTCDVSKMTTAIIRPPSAQAAPGASTPAAAVEPVPVSKATLANGATTLIGVDPTLPIAAIVVGFRGGVRVETEPQQGISHLVAQLLTKGTAQHSASQIARQVESLGGSLEAFSGRDGFGLMLQLLSQDLDKGLTLAHELVSRSTFHDAELEIQRELTLNALRAQDDELFDVGGRLLRRALFPGHPYRFQPLGDRETVGRLTRADCLEFAKRWLVPSNMVVAVFGDVDGASVSQVLQQTMGTIPARDSSWPARLPSPHLDEVAVVSQTMEREQALIMLGFRGSTFTAEDRYALDVLTAALSGMSGRLFQAVREQHGLSYTLGAVHVPGWDPGYLLVYAATRPAERATVLTLLEEQLALAVEKGFTDEEVDEAKRYLIGLHRLELQHVVGLAKRSVLDELYGVGFDAWTTYEAKLNGVTAPMVHAAAERYLTLQQRAQVIISPNGHAPASSQSIVHSP
ncbi:MAG: pitrilysin family protein [Candidatus Omnitrophota bacterium]|nr:pitrilysin family protein [Candidatus Omnitrophota bacterium]